MRRLLRLLWSDLRRAVMHRNGQRAVMAWAVLVNVGVLAWTYPDGWWPVQVVCLAWLTASQVFIERRRRLWLFEDAFLTCLGKAEHPWQYAYLGTLDVQQVKDLAAWLEEHDTNARPVDDLPPVVAGWVYATVRPPWEA